jgi:transposase-like protein
MDPTTTFCPNPECPARGQAGEGNIRIHSRKDQRFLCTTCHKTFSATKGTAFYRLRTSAETVTLVVTLLAHGCPLQAIVIAFGVDERTVASWLARAGGQGQAVQEHLVEQPRERIGFSKHILRGAHPADTPRERPSKTTPSDPKNPSVCSVRRLSRTRARHSRPE